VNAGPLAPKENPGSLALKAYADLLAPRDLPDPGVNAVLPVPSALKGPKVLKAQPAMTDER